MSKKIILLAGPTASGKSKLAIKLAKKIKGEIINADSMQVYKEFSILSSRPTKKDLKEVRHHLYGFVPVKKHFSVGLWLKYLKKKIKVCEKNKKIPIIVGGTGLYFTAITRGISTIPSVDIKTKNLVKKLYKDLGHKLFYEKLLSIDSKVKNKILPTDTQRVLRAFEVKLKTKKSIYDWASNTKSIFSKYDIECFFLDIPRNELLIRISARTKKMFKDGCINEVKEFLKLKLNKSLPSNKLIGVKEITNYLDGFVDLEKTKELISIKTRQYAKRQNTWSRGHMKNWNYIYSEDLRILIKKVLKVIS